MTSMTSTLIGGATLAAFLAAVPAAAQAPAPTDPVLWACHQPNSGIVYRVNAPDDPGGNPNLRDACSSDGHVLFSWSDARGAEHGGLAGLGDDDHPQYLLIDGSRALTGALAAGDNKLTGLAPATASGDAVRFDEAVLDGDAAGGDLSGTYPGPTVAALQGQALSGATPATGQLLGWDGSAWTPTDAASVVDDHGGLGGLTDDDHTQYLLTDGVRASRGFAVAGAPQGATIPVEGRGVRLMWHPAKAAFRAGQVLGDEWDEVNIGETSMALGQGTIASGDQAVALGGFTEASGSRSFAMGTATTASSGNAVALGSQTTASGGASLAGGSVTTAAGGRSIAFGSRVETIPNANNSVALGFEATAAHSGSFVFGDLTNGTRLATSAPHQFMVRASNGVSFFTHPDLLTGVRLTPGSGTWASLSDRNAKENIRPEDPEAVLQAVADLPVSSWNYKAQDASIRHVGPMAQDFHAAFGLGDGETTINTVDIDGINMLAIQALERRTRELERLEARLAETENRIAELEAALQTLLAQVGSGAR